MAQASGLLLLTASLLCAANGLQSVCQEPLQLGESYTIQVNISSPKSLCYLLDSSTKNQALRWHGSAGGALIQHPLLVTVRQPRGVSSLSIPYLENGFAHNEVYRILCPLLNIDTGTSPGESLLLIDLSTSSIGSISFSLEMEIFQPFELELNKPQTLISSPSSPTFMIFEFPDDLENINVKVTASEETKTVCAIASIQNAYCPVVQLLDHSNTDDRGKFQTMRSLASFDLKKGDKFSFFYVVVSVFPSDGPNSDCLYPKTKSSKTLSVKQAPDYSPTVHTGGSRIKNVTITLEPGLNTATYVTAMAVLTAFMLCSYAIVLFWIIFFEWLQYKKSTVTKVREEAGIPDEIFNALYKYYPVKESSEGSGDDQPGSSPTSLHPLLEDGDEEEKESPSLFSIVTGHHWHEEREKFTLKREKTLSYISSAPSSPHAPQAVEHWRALKHRQSSILRLGETTEGGQSTGDDGPQEPEFKYDKGPFPVNVYLSEVGPIDESQSAYDYYPHYVFVVLVFYSLPVFQLLHQYIWFTGQGNEDVCYYNFLCANSVSVFGIHFIAFNNIFSNIGFLAMGILIILITARRRSLYRLYNEINLSRPRDKKVGIPHQFGIYYAIGVAMMGQAVLSSAYHMCPTQENLRFDATFICIQTGIGIHKFLQTRIPDKNPILHDIMMMFAALMLSITVGMIQSESLLFWVPFSTAYVLISLIFAVEIYYRWEIDSWEKFKQLFQFWRTEGVFPPRHKTKFVHSLATVALNFALIWFGFWYLYTNFANFITYVLLGNDVLHLIAYLLSKIAHKELTRKTTPLKQIALAVLAVLCWGLAVINYTQEITNWDKSPAMSRDQNVACGVMGFFDSHDAWHITAAFAIFFTTALTMNVDDRLENQTRDKIFVF